MSKYAGNVQQRVEPTAADFTIPSASCIAGSANEGGEYQAAQARAQSQYESLGFVACPGDAGQSCFYSARYVYGEGWKGGYQDQPSSAHTLEMFWKDRVVTFNGHGAANYIQNRLGDGVTAGMVADYAATHPEPAAKFVSLKCCSSFQQVAPALVAASVDCVVGFASTTSSADTGWAAFMDRICDKGMTIAQAFWATYYENVGWQFSMASITGNSTLWGEPL